MLVWLRAASVGALCVFKFLPYVIVASMLGSVLIECDNVHDGLWICLLILLGDTRLLEELLPFPWQPSELSCVRVEADVREVDWIVGRGNFDAFRLRKDV